MGVELTDPDIMARYQNSSDEEMPFGFDPFKKAKPMSKEERLYGIWADDDKVDREHKNSKDFKNKQEYKDDSSDDDMIHRAGFSMPNNEPKSKGKSKFINFVSGGLKKGTLKKGGQVVFDPKADAEKEKLEKEKQDTQ